MSEVKNKKYICDNPRLIAEWDWEANNNLSLNPCVLTHGSTKCVRWICPKGHKFSARIDHRTIMGSGCPYCANKLPYKGETDLATTHPNLLIEWDYANNDLSPEEYVAGSNKKVNWICKDCGTRWKTKVVNRAIKKSGCPECMRAQRPKTKNKNLIEQRGSLFDAQPEIAAEWDDEKNYPLSPDDVLRCSNKIVWWRGKCGHSWEASISNRIQGNGCPVCAGKIVLQGFNDLAFKFPQIASEWHPNLNQDILPDTITAHNDRKVWWLCPECGEAYFTSIYSRTSLQTGCPVCSNKIVAVGKNDLQTTHLEIAKEWNYKRNGRLLPTEVVSGSNKRVWWKCNEGHEWATTVSSRTSGCACPICAIEIRTVNRQKSNLIQKGSLEDHYPAVAKQWHPTRNEALTPNDLTSGSDKYVWWVCERGHEWQATVSSRTAGRGCPQCNNEHSTSFPEQALFFYLTKVTDAVNRYKLEGRELDIYLPDLNIGIEYNGRYYHRNRVKQDENKYNYFREQGMRVIVVCEGEKEFVDGDNIYYRYINSDYMNLDSIVSTIFELCSLPNIDVNIKRDRVSIYEQFVLQEKSNSIAETYPHLIEEWDYERNGKLTPWLVSHGSSKRIYWKCPKCGYKWDAVAYSRKKGGCPCCAKRVAVSGINDLCTTHPQLLKEWDMDKNDISPESVVAGSHRYVWWICENGHGWRAQIKSRAQGCGCPICANKA